MCVITLHPVCSQSAASLQQLNRAESQPSLNMQLPPTHTFESYDALLFLVPMSFSRVYDGQHFPIISAPPLQVYFASIWFG